MSREENRQKRKRYNLFNLRKSVVSRMILVIILFIVPINVMILVLTQANVRRLREEADQEVQFSMDMKTNMIRNDLDLANKQLLILVDQDADAAVLASSYLAVTDRSLAKESSFVKTHLEDIKNQFEYISPLYMFFPRNSSLVMVGTKLVNAQEARKTITAVRENLMPKYGTTWVASEIGGRLTLCSASQWLHVEFGMVVDGDALVGDIRKEMPGRRWILCNKDETVFDHESLRFLLDHQTTFQQIKENKAYRVFVSELEGYDLKLVMLEENPGFFGNMAPQLKLLYCLAIVLTFTVIPVLLLLFRRWISRPLQDLSDAIDEIEGGNLDYRVTEKEPGEEFTRLNRNFNSMMDQVEDLKIDVYEKELARKELQMTYLSRQVQPHFILNAMNILYSYEPEEYNLAQKMILCISKYFRYIVKVNAEFVPLYQEMDHIANYFEIQKARFPDLFQASIEYEPEVKDVPIPPLTVQNIAENAIKHSLKIGNRISIIIKASKFVNEDGEEMVSIRLKDTGEGIPDIMLQEIAAFRETGEPQEHLGVGISNTIERIKHLYNGRGSFEIWKDEEIGGTGAEFRIPFHLTKGKR